MDKIKTLLKRYFNVIIGKTKEISHNRNVFVFLVFLFLSTGFWILNALSKDNYTTEINYPIKFVKPNDKELIKGSVKRDLVLKVKGGGFAILKYHLNEQFSTDYINLSDLKRVKSGGVEGALLTTRDYISRIEGKLANGLDLISISPDTLFIPLVEKVSRKLPVVVDAQISFGQQCQLSGPILVSPDSVFVSGPQNILDSITCVYTKHFSYEKVTDTLVRNVLLKDSEWLEYDKKRVVVTIPVEPFTEAFVMVPIEAKNLPDTLNFKSFPSEVKVSYHVGLTRSLYRSSDFNAIVDFSSIIQGNLPRRLKVKFANQPEQINNMTYSPLFVEYLLERK